MKVKITHTVDLDSVAERSKELIYPAVENIQKALSSLEALDFLLSGDEEELNLAVQLMDLTRTKLGQADNVLNECHAMLSGVNDYNLQQIEKRVMEEQLIKQEEEQKREQAEQLAQQQQADPSPPVTKLWDPITKTTSIIDPEEGGK